MSSNILGLLFVVKFKYNHENEDLYVNNKTIGEFVSHPLSLLKIL